MGNAKMTEAIGADIWAFYMDDAVWEGMYHDHYDINIGTEENSDVCALNLSQMYPLDHFGVIARQDGASAVDFDDAFRAWYSKRALRTVVLTVATSDDLTELQAFCQQRGWALAVTA